MIYLDNASTSLKPKQVLDAERDYYEKIGAQIGRGTHKSAFRAGEMVHESRKEIANFIGAKETEIIFTKNATEGINIVANSLERKKYFKKGDEIIISAAEHHANLIPWQQLCLRTGAKLKIVNLNEDFTLNFEDFEEKVSRRTKLVAMGHAFNTVASIIPASEIGKIAHENKALFLLDGAQTTPDLPVNVKKLNCDFFVFSGHKMLGPTGVGCLYMEENLIEKMPAHNFGGGTIKKVEYAKTEFLKTMEKFEPGTYPIAQIIGFGEAVKYLKKIGMENIREHEQKLLKHFLKKTQEIPSLNLYCPCDEKKQRAIVLFELAGVDPLDLASALDEAKNIAIRSGMHCAEPIVSSINKQGLARASFYLYNTIEEIDVLTDEVTAISKAVQKSGKKHLES